ncbi:MAG: aspartate kinase [bacterium]
MKHTDGMTVMKFGGSSVADAACIDRVANIVIEAHGQGPVGVVVSALKGTTDSLLSAAECAERGDGAYKEQIEALEQRHYEVVETLHGSESADGIRGVVHDMFGELKNILHGVDLVRECTDRTADLIAGFGELLSIRILDSVLLSRGKRTRVIDPRLCIITDQRHRNARVIRSLTYERLAEQIRNDGYLYLIPGFIAATADGITTTLGRNGSDYTASLVAAAVHARELQIWTDVDGVLSADPRYVPDAFLLPELTFAEAAELSYFGAEVLHPSTMVPVVEKDIPVGIRNTWNPSGSGTRITARARSGGEIAGIASIDNVAIINVEGSGMVGIPGIAARLFAAIARAQANIIMISQASSEHTICLCFRTHEAQDALKELEREFSTEIVSGEIDRPQLQAGMEIVAIIGEAMRGHPGISGRLFQALGEAKVSVHAIAQGSSERNISFIVAESEREVTLQTVHRAFFQRREGPVA